jgi:hypothetical protein
MNIDILNKWISAAQSDFIIGGVVIGIWQLMEFSAQTRLQAQTLRSAGALPS